MHWIFAVVSFAIFITDNQRLWLHKGQFYQSIFFIRHRNKKVNAKSSVILNALGNEKSLRLVFKRMEFNHWDGENKAHCFIHKTCFVPIFHLFSSFTIFILHSKNKQKIWGVKEKCSYILLSDYVHIVPNRVGRCFHILLSIDNSICIVSSRPKLNF